MERRWRFKDVSVTLPVVLVRSMFDRARKYDRGEGGRFDARTSTVVLWYGPACAERPWTRIAKLPLPGRAPARVPSGSAAGS